MNKIVREFYPVSSLPDDLKAGLDEDALVRIVIEETPEDRSGSPETMWAGYPDDEEASRPVASITEVLEGIRLYKASHPSTETEEEVVRRIRELRDEWDDE
ncbi:hypothetical protein [Rhizobium sp. NFR03]|uniref:hypothetical protein n=1 Tax=Rhizobium sp. NFR03 TaxID=1566263 RepID=UPI0008ABD551|nr:hypothetical protein [Rhizobium sp. NFR03]SER83255.1 hypothetical protein SAMN03159406_01189 [Rhizobium sp. NFR03]